MGNDAFEGDIELQGSDAEDVKAGAGTHVDLGIAKAGLTDQAGAVQVGDINVGGAGNSDRVGVQVKTGKTNVGLGGASPGGKTAKRVGNRVKGHR